MKTTPNISKIRLHSLAAILSRPRLKRSGERRSLLTMLLLIALTAAAFFYLAERPRRYAVFAGYSADGSVAPYVLRYLSGLKAVTDGIVYITDSPLSPEAQKQVAPYVIHGEYQRHGEYDWGSYKRGYNWLKAKNLLRHTDELIFANDSAYAPLQTFRPMFNQMRSRSELDFWGNTQNQRFNPHLQSYFLVFRRPVIMSKSFAAFLNGVKAQPDHSLYITEYEIKLTPFLQNLGYKWDSYIPDFPSASPARKATSAAPLRPGSAAALSPGSAAALSPDSAAALSPGSAAPKPASAARASVPASPDPNSYPLTLIRDYHNQFLKRRTFTDKLPIEENRAELLAYLCTHAPETCQNIAADFPNTVFPAAASPAFPISGSSAPASDTAASSGIPPRAATVPAPASDTAAAAVSRSPAAHTGSAPNR